MKKFLFVLLICLRAINTLAQTTLRISYFNDKLPGCYPAINSLEIIVFDNTRCLTTSVRIPVPVNSPGIKIYKMGEGPFVRFAYNDFIFLGANINGLCPGFLTIGLVPPDVGCLSRMSHSFHCQDDNPACQNSASWDVSGSIATLDIK